MARATATVRALAHRLLSSLGSPIRPRAYAAPASSGGRRVTYDFSVDDAYGPFLCFGVTTREQSEALAPCRASLLRDSTRITQTPLDRDALVGRSDTVQGYGVSSSQWPAPVKIVSPSVLTLIEETYDPDVSIPSTSIRYAWGTHTDARGAVAVLDALGELRGFGLEVDPSEGPPVEQQVNALEPIFVAEVAFAGVGAIYEELRVNDDIIFRALGTVGAPVTGPTQMGSAASYIGRQGAIGDVWRAQQSTGPRSVWSLLGRRGGV